MCPIPTFSGMEIGVTEYVIVVAALKSVAHYYIFGRIFNNERMAKSFLLFITTFILSLIITVILLIVDWQGAIFGWILGIVWQTIDYFKPSPPESKT